MVREHIGAEVTPRHIETFTLPPNLGSFFIDKRPDYAVALPWDMLPPLDEVGDQAMEDAAGIIDPAFFELQAARQEREDQDPSSIAPLLRHEREVAALLRVALSDQIVPPFIRTFMAAYGLVHDEGKTTPLMQAEYSDGSKWLPDKIDRLSKMHEAIGEAQCMAFAEQDGAHFALESLAVLVGGHHQRDLAAIEDPRVRWMIGIFQEADGSQAILLDERKYMGDGTTREGISLDNFTALESRIVRPFQAPHYFGIHPGRIFNAALGFRAQRVAALEAEGKI